MAAIKKGEKLKVTEATGDTVAETAGSSTATVELEESKEDGKDGVINTEGKNEGNTVDESSGEMQYIIINKLQSKSFQF